MGHSCSLQAGEGPRGAQPVPSTQGMLSQHLAPAPQIPCLAPNPCTAPTPPNPDPCPLPSLDPGHSPECPLTAPKPTWP